MRYWKKFVDSLQFHTNEDMIKMCQEAGLVQLNKVYDYSSRIVFVINDKWIIKIALSNTGIIQNQNEIRVWEGLGLGYDHLKKYFARLYPDYCDDWDYRYVVMERLTNSTESKKGLLKEVNNTQTLLPVLKIVDAHCGTLNHKDFKISNIGKTKNNRIKVLDYGCCNTIAMAYRMYYTHKEKSYVKRVEI